VVLLGVAAAAIAFSQPQAPAPPSAARRFEVASIKPNKSGSPTGTWTSPIATVGSRFTATNVTLVDVIVQAYRTRRIQMQGGPGWIDSERFDIVAKADAAEGDVVRDQWPVMIQALLEDRFKLVYHWETKDMPVLALVGKLPAAFQESKDGTPNAMVPGDRGKLTFQHWPMTGLVNLTSNILRTPVVDGTGIKGAYDFSVDPMQFAAADNAAGPAPTYADLFETALREQLGFRLEKRKAPLEIMVIDQASRPAEN
jgi:uncharacterized protein (TIGR03435 family)